MEETKTCGCIVDYRPIDPAIGATIEPRVEIVIEYCEAHRPRPADQGSG